MEFFEKRRFRILDISRYFITVTETYYVMLLQNCYLTPDDPNGEMLHRDK